MLKHNECFVEYFFVEDRVLGEWAVWNVQATGCEYMYVYDCVEHFYLRNQQLLLQ